MTLSEVCAVFKTGTNYTVTVYLENKNTGEYETGTFELDGDKCRQFVRSTYGSGHSAEFFVLETETAYRFYEKDGGDSWAWYEHERGEDDEDVGLVCDLIPIPVFNRLFDESNYTHSEPDSKTNTYTYTGGDRSLREYALDDFDSAMFVIGKDGIKLTLETETTTIIITLAGIGTTKVTIPPATELIK
ncbi:MAG: hypothetical protein FWE62_06415 [Firmicutes bacterium]|nr:hypothetical protein [Bacillota bacterium]